MEQLASNAGTGLAAVGPVAPPTGAPQAESRQRWRITFARDRVSSELVGRVLLDAWHEALRSSGLPVAGLDPGSSGRARLAFGAPLPAAASGEAELADLWLLERLPLWTLREALADRLPVAHRWVAAEDVWLGAPALAGQIAAADWRVEVEMDPDTIGRLREAALVLLHASELPRTRRKGETEKRYDLRPLLVDLAVDGPVGPGPATIRTRTRFDPELGTGRPEEVVAALGEAAGLEVAIGAIVRERLVLADDLRAVAERTVQIPGLHDYGRPPRRPGPRRR